MSNSILNIPPTPQKTKHPAYNPLLSLLSELLLKLAHSFLPLLCLCPQPGHLWWESKVKFDFRSPRPPEKFSAPPISSNGFSSAPPKMTFAPPPQPVSVSPSSSSSLSQPVSVSPARKSIFFPGSPPPCFSSSLRLANLESFAIEEFPEQTWWLTGWNLAAEGPQKF